MRSVYIEMLQLPYNVFLRRRIDVLLNLSLLYTIVCRNDISFSEISSVHLIQGGGK